MIRVLVACEFSGIVRESFLQYSGVYAMSCDLLPPEDGRVDYHYQGDVREILNENWDMIIGHPPCTYLCNSGIHLLHKDRSRWAKLDAAAKLFRDIYRADCRCVAVENPVMHPYAIERIGCGKHNQTIQPFEFGHPESKRTCLWLRGLPLLKPTKILKLPASGHWDNQTKSGQNKLSPSPDRWKKRSRTYPGIAAAFAEQWLPVIL